MAATPFQTPLPEGSFVFDIFNDGTPARNAPHLPGGGCNFVDLAYGANGAKCGCRRFWSRIPGVGLPANLSGEQAVWCMCSHHACFHDDNSGDRGQTQPAGNGAIAAGQENEKPKGNREPLSPVQELPSFHMPSNLGLSMGFPDMDINSFAAAFNAEHQGAAADPALDQASVAAPESTLPDTLPWGVCAQSQDGYAALPPIPSQCLLPSKPPSTASSSQTRYIRPFAGKGLQTLSSVPKSRDPPWIRGAGNGPEAGTAPATTADDAVQHLTTASSGASTIQESVDLADHKESASPTGMSHGAFHQLSETVLSHEQRIDKLETASFSAAGHDECHEKHDYADLRVTDLELRVEEVEKKLNDDNSTVASSRHFRDDDATISVVSMRTNAAADAHDRSEMYTQIQALQAKVNSLQASSLPSYNKPWEVEVVFLPFPLKGLWTTPADFVAQRSDGGNADEWTQYPNTLSRQTPDPHSPTLQWIDHTSDAQWLWPRACVPGRMIDKRLKSRGLIKRITVKGSDARSVQLAMSVGFSNVLRNVSARPTSAARRFSQPDTRPTQFLGLQQAWVPLRKLHKDSRLRFLTPAEMLTPALWDVAFLMSSVVMKATGTHRLYVTQPEAYLQNMRSGEGGWCWQRLRELSRVCPDSQGSSSTQEVGEADAAEECWAWDDRLDEPPNASPGGLSLRYAGKGSNKSNSSGSTQQFFTGIQSPIVATSPILLRAQSPLVTSRPPRVRTSSMPPVMPAILSPSGLGKRRVVSYANPPPISSYDRRSSPFFGSSRPSPRVQIMTSPAMGAAVSKRRGTKSPSLRPRTTPRWSLSRSPSLAPFISADDAARATTPFCYATPYSNAAFEHPRHGSRPPVPVNGYDDADMDDDCGSGTDSYGDDEMVDGGEYDFHIREDAEDDALSRASDESESLRDERRQQIERSQSHYDQVHARAGQLPEDEPWPGIEDNMSDGENMDPASPLSQVVYDYEGQGHEHRSDVSSQPSEYPSTQRAWHFEEGDDAAQAGVEVAEEGGAFKIHED